MPQRRQMNAGGILMSNPKFSPAQYMQGESIETIKRKKLRREMIFGSKQSYSGGGNAQYFAKMQKEDI